MVREILLLGNEKLYDVSEEVRREELPEIRHRVNYRLAKEWSKVATIP